MSIGGYNQLSICEFNKDLRYEGAYEFQSARAALYAFLLAENIDNIYVPNYICDSIFPGIASLDINVIYYEINESLLPDEGFEISDNSKILIVNYFGLLTNEINEIVSSNPSSFIVDNSQSLFSKHIKNTTSLYSPRKFVGIPDGGFLLTSNIIHMPDEKFDSTGSLGHLLLRAAGDVELGYRYFLSAEKYLDDFTPKKISTISSYLLNHVDISEICNKRRDNFIFFNNEFESVNELKFKLSDQVPLCYPLKLSFDVRHIHKYLVSQGVYLARYWDSIHNGCFGQGMFNQTLFLPIDERLNPQDLIKVKDLIEKYLD